MVKNVRCEKRNGSQLDILKPKIKNLNEMTFVSSKNHRNKNLDELISKINFKKTIVMGSIGCKIASIIRGKAIFIYL